MEQFICVTSQKTPVKLQVEAINDFLENIYSYNEVTIRLNDLSYIIAISLNTSEEELANDEKLLEKLSKINLDDSEIIDTVELEDTDCHIYKADLLYKKNEYQIYQAVDVRLM